MVLVYCTAHTSGGQLNWAVTFGLMCAGMLEPLQGCANMLAQLFGAVLGATLLLATLPEAARGTLGSNQIQGDYTKGAAFIAEMIFTYFLVFTVFQTALMHAQLLAPTRFLDQLLLLLRLDSACSLPIFS